MKTTILTIKATSLAVITMLLLGSCQKSFLDLKPKGKVILQSANDYDLALNNGNFIVNNVDVGVPMGDEVVAMDNYFSAGLLRSQRLFRWDDVIYDDGFFALEMSGVTSSLYAYNKIANEVMSSTDGTDAQKKALL